LAAELAKWLARPRAEPLKDGVRVVVAGPTNAGKSSLVNAIAGTERAIVTAVPGTTRDFIEVPLALAGVPILLTDTAGLRESADTVERLGVNRARGLVEGADVLLWLGEPSDGPQHPRRIIVHPRADLPDRKVAPHDSMATSSATGEGIAALVRRIADLARTVLPGEGALALNRRQADHLGQAYEALQHAANARDFVIQAEDLRVSRETLDRLTGRAGVEDLLDSLFGRFCLGK